MNKEIEMLYKTIEAKDKIINEQVLEISKLKGILQEIYERAINTNITSLDLRDYLIVILGDKECPKGFKSYEDYKKKEQAFVDYFCGGDKENE